MNEINLQALAQRVQEGDKRAKVQLEERLEPQLGRIVRHVLQRGTATSSLERKILATAHRLSAITPRESDPDAEPVVRNLCQMVINRLWPGGTERMLRTIQPV